MRSIEEKIIELRLAEAVQKDLFGQSSILHTIVKSLGSEIIQDNFPNSTLDFMSDDYLEEKVREFDINHTSTIIGYHFDGLRMGFSLEILYKENYGSLKVIWQNRTVYEECDGELISYNPLNEWEDKINQLYKKAEIKIKNIAASQEELLQSQAKKEEDKEIKRLREKWGIN